MANLEFIDSFMHYDTATEYQKYENPGNNTLVPAAGRFGVQGLEVGLFSGGPQATFKTNPTSIYAGGALYLGTFSRVLIQHNNNLSPYVSCGVRNDARVYLQIGTVIHVSLVTVHLNSWYYFELNGLINVGGEQITAEVKVNEISVLSAATTSALEYHTIVDGNGAYFTSTQPYGVSPGDARLSDWYVNKTDYLGDVLIRYIKPNGVGHYNDWGFTGAASAWQATSEVPPDGDASYISTHTVTQKTSCAMENVALSGGACLGVQFLANGQKTNANIRSITPFVRTGGSDLNGDELSLPYGYVYTHDCQDTHYSESDLNAIEVGVELTA